jgi:intracellular multiplication protein IcmL
MAKQGAQAFVFSIWLFIILNVAAIGFGIYYFTHESEPAYYAVTNVEGKLYATRMVPLTSPITNIQAIREWSIDAITSAYTYDAANYKQQIATAMQQYFTDEGAASFQQSLQDSGAITQLLSKKLIVTAAVYGQPVVLAQGLLLGERTWKIQAPLLVTYQSASDVVVQRYIVTITIVSQPTWRFPNGIGIQQFIVANAPPI